MSPFLPLRYLQIGSVASMRAKEDGREEGVLKEKICGLATKPTGDSNLLSHATRQFMGIGIVEPSKSQFIEPVSGPINWDLLGRTIEIPMNCLGALDKGLELGVDRESVW